MKIGAHKEVKALEKWPAESSDQLPWEYPNFVSFFQLGYLNPTYGVGMVFTIVNGGY